MHIAGHCFTITEITQTSLQNANLRLKLYLKSIVFGPNVSISTALVCFSHGETMTCNPNLLPATC